METILVSGRETKVWTVEIFRPDRRNALNGPTAQALYEIFQEFEQDKIACVAILYGRGGVFCAGADLTEMSNPLNLSVTQVAPMGISRLRLKKPTIAAIDGYCVAGGLELALWCDLRVATESSIFGVFCRRWGVPLIDGGTIRLPRLIGQSRAMDMILTGRPVEAKEALSFGLINRLVSDGQSLIEARKLADDLCKVPQDCMRSDRKSSLDQWSLPETVALANEFALGLPSLQKEGIYGAQKFKGGLGRKGSML